MKTLTICTRESPLALSQAYWVRDKLSELYPELIIELYGITTQADKMLSISLAKVGGKGLFVKELEEALLDGRAQLAVHSMKDMPMDYPAGLTVPVICQREDARDVLIAREVSSLDELRSGARIGTSSLRRRCQLQAAYPHLQIEDLRGNVNTRLARLDAGDFDALILAAAGIKRLHLENRISAYIPTDLLLPAVGQGALALECPSEAFALHTLLAPLNDEITATCVKAERALCKALGGGCQVPVAAYAEMLGDELELRALVGSADGQQIIRAQGRAKRAQAESLGKQLAQELLDQGAEAILSLYR